MENKNKITIIGVPASPYTRKMLSALRYRNIQHSVIWGNAKEILNSMGLETPKPTLLPVVLLHDGSEVTAICDTTVSYTHLRAHETKANRVCRLKG